MNHTVVASFSFALLVAVALLVREVRFRRSLQKLLCRLLAVWRTNSHEEHDTELQRSIQAQRDNLELERKAIAVERRFESLRNLVIETTGVLLVAALPLVLCWYLLHGMRGQDEDVSEVLISQLVREMVWSAHTPLAHRR